MNNWLICFVSKDQHKQATRVLAEANSKQEALTLQDAAREQIAPDIEWEFIGVVDIGEEDIKKLSPDTPRI